MASQGPPLKRAKTEEVISNEEKEMKVDLWKKLEHFREFTDNTKKIQDLELEILSYRRRNKKLEDGYPDLSQVEGIYDKWYKEDMVTAITSDGRKRLFGDHPHSAKEAYEKKKAKTEEIRKKNKELAAKKKAGRSQ